MQQSEPSADVFAPERQQRIARHIEEHGRARVVELAGSFGVSSVTIRKDLLALEQAGQVARVHGGAIALAGSRAERAFDVRERINREAKDLIGRMAAETVADGDSVAFDASTTALSVARRLKARGPWAQLTVITNGLRIALELAGHPGITVFMPGGVLRWEALSLVGHLGDGIFGRVNIQKAFVGAVGFSLEAGLSDATEEEAEIKKVMTTAAREVIAIVDASKWERAAFATFCPTSEITTVITDADAPERMMAELRAMGIDVMVATPPAARDEYRARPADAPVGR